MSTLNRESENFSNQADSILFSEIGQEYSKFSPANICQIFQNSSTISHDIKSGYRSVVNEFENYISMVLERNFGQNWTLQYNESLIDNLRATIGNIPAEFYRKLRQTQHIKFGEMDTQDKFLCIKKLCQILENSERHESPVFEEVKVNFCLGLPTIEILFLHLKELDTKQWWNERTKPWRDWLWDYFYRNFRYFSISHADSRQILDAYFDEMYDDKDELIRKLGRGDYIGNTFLSYTTHLSRIFTSDIVSNLTCANLYIFILYILAALFLNFDTYIPIYKLKSFTVQNYFTV